MKIYNKEYQVGDHIKILSAKSILHYDYGLTGDEIQEMSGLTGIIIKIWEQDKNAIAKLLVDEPFRERYKNGIIVLYWDDEIEKEGEENGE